VAVAVLAWFGYRAAREWRRSSEMLVQRRAEQAADVFARALLRDMRGVESTILRGLRPEQIALADPQELTDLVASAFARYPYPEAFFAWSHPADPGAAVFFTRADRRPPWMPELPVAGRYPVAFEPHAATAAALIERIAPTAAHGQRFAVFETELGGQRYQVVARLLYRTSRRAELQRVFGFFVNLGWVRRAYFTEMSEVLGRIAAEGTSLSTAILDEEARLVAGRLPATGSAVTAERRIRPLFFDPSLVGLDPGESLPRQQWAVVVSAAGDPAGRLGFGRADSTIAITTVAVSALIAGLLLTARALRASADLAKLRFDFVSSVTHELKTPLSTIRVVGETLSNERLQPGPKVREYAHLLDQEAKRLTRLVDNLLAYSRVTDVSEIYSFEPTDLTDLFDDVLHEFQPQFVHQRFDVTVDLPADLPPVTGDRTALGLVLDNLVDNAVRYSTASRRLTIAARRDGAFVAVAVTDCGIGIPPEELAVVVRRFVRGRHAGLHGSGLGLAIASRVIGDHGGTLNIESTVGAGTTVRVRLPVA
jgi:signal transduction histidine kinase